MDIKYHIFINEGRDKMGSAGTGRFGDYFPPKTNSNICEQSLESITLEDVGLSKFYNNNNIVPNIGREVEIAPNIINGRLVVQTTDTKEVVGNMPSKYNYILACLKSNYWYTGVVIYSSKNPIPNVVVDLNAR